MVPHTNDDDEVSQNLLSKASVDEYLQKRGLNGEFRLLHKQAMQVDYPSLEAVQVACGSPLASLSVQGKRL